MLLIYRPTLPMILRMGKESGLGFKVGFEIEFILLKSTFPAAAVQSLEHYSASLALPTGSIQEIVLEEIVESLEGSGIEVVMFHPEGAPGQVRFPDLHAIIAVSLNVAI